LLRKEKSSYSESDEEEIKQRKCMLHMLKLMLRWFPGDRYSTNELLNHPFITGEPLESFREKTRSTPVNKRQRSSSFGFGPNLQQYTPPEFSNSHTHLLGVSPQIHQFGGFGFNGYIQDYGNMGYMGFPNSDPYSFPRNTNSLSFNNEQYTDPYYNYFNTNLSLNEQIKNENTEDTENQQLQYNNNGKENQQNYQRQYNNDDTENQNNYRLHVNNNGGKETQNKRRNNNNGKEYQHQRRHSNNSNDDEDTENQYFYPKIKYDDEEDNKNNGKKKFYKEDGSKS